MKLRFRIFFIAWTGVILILSIGCAALRSPEQLPPLSQPSWIFLQDDWNGYASFAPLEAKFNLKPTTDNYTGTVYFAAGGNFGQTFTVGDRIEIPLDVADRFLATLSEVSLAESGYAIPTSAPDDYLQKSIRLELDKKTVTFSTNSSDGGWKITITTPDDVKGKVYTIRTTLPNQAIELVNPYLKRDVQQKLIDQANQASR